MGRGGGLEDGENPCQETAISGPRISTADAFSRLFGNTLVLSSLLTLQSGQVGRDLPQHMDFHLGGGPIRCAATPSMI